MSRERGRCRARKAAAKAATEARSARSRAMKVGTPQAGLGWRRARAATASAARKGERQARITSVPRASSREAASKPKPLFAPVTMASGRETDMLTSQQGNSGRLVPSRFSREKTLKSISS